MIIRETDTHFICYTQPDHAALCGAVAEAWNKDLLPTVDLFHKACYAIEHHDDAWLVPDTIPIWNDLTGKPYSFLDYPVLFKLHFYTHGINLLKHAYAQWLCSKHYVSFYRSSEGDAEKEFVLNEQLRQEKIQHETEMNETVSNYHFAMLQFCDDVSLAICLAPEIDETQETKFAFNEGFKQSNTILQDDKIIRIRRVAPGNFVLENSPLSQEVSFLLPYKRLSKELIREKGLADAWKNTATAHQTIMLG